MTGTIITSGTTIGYYLGNYNPVTVAANVTISDVNNPGISSLLGTYWTIVNYGTLLATGIANTSDGVLLAGGGGSVTNMAGGSIAGYNFGVSIAGTGTVVNQGVIATGNTNTTAPGFNYVDGAFTPTTAGVLLGSGGVYNAPSALITGYLGGVAVDGGGSVVNAGTILASSGRYGFGVALPAGGSITNAQDGTIHAGLDAVLTFAEPSTVINQGVIYAQYGLGVALTAGGALTNSSTGLISGNADGIVGAGAAATTITNSGFVYGYANAGVWLNAGGAVTNSGPAGYILGKYFGVKVSNAAGTVDNSGSISAFKTFNQSDSFESAGVQLADGGVLTNEAGGFVGSKWIGVQVGESLNASVGGTVDNYGTILATDTTGVGAGIWIHGPGTITNGAGDRISGGGFGIISYYQVTVVNQGVVFGTDYAFDAINPGFADRIIDQPGGVFYGTVTGGNALGSATYSTLELASGSSTGTITNIGTFVDFGRIELDAGATWSVGGSLAAGEAVAFGGADASLILATPPNGASVTGFAATDTIVLSGITDVTGLSYGAGNAVTVEESVGPGVTLQFDSAPALTWSTGNGYTSIVVPCFLPGTFILTDQGEVPVERLEVGDSIVTMSGRVRRLCWIGRGRTMATRGRRNAATPVIVRKGALADNVPHHDLHITKGHSLYLDGVLIPVEFLVNHRSILWDDRAQEVAVYHLELDAHDVLLANGVAAESYRDDGNRWLFQNANAGWEQPAKAACAPVLTGGEVVDAVWKRLLDRAGPRPGLPLTDDPDLHLLVDGERVDAHDRHGPVWVFRLVGPPERVCVMSREAVPAELGVARDARSLGVALWRLAVRQGTKFVLLEANDDRLADGFYDYEAEGNLRWTDGAATLPAEAFAGFRGALEVVLHVAATTRYPEYGGQAVRVAA